MARLWWQGGYRGGLCEKLLETLPCPAELIPASSRMDLPLAKAEPINCGSNASAIIYFRRETKKLLHRSN